VAAIDDAKGAHPAVLIGKDTRISGYMLEAALEAGFAAAGVDVMLTDRCRPPPIAYLTGATLTGRVVIKRLAQPVSRKRHQVLFGGGQKLPEPWRWISSTPARPPDSLQGVGPASEKRAASRRPGPLIDLQGHVFRPRSTFAG